MQYFGDTLWNWSWILTAATYQDVIFGTLIPTPLNYDAAQHPSSINTNFSPQTFDCNAAHYAGPINPSFETGDLTGWSIVSGTAFSSASVTSTATYWGGPFNQNGTYHLFGFQAAGDTAVGVVTSSSFQASSAMSFLVSGGYDPASLYIGLVLDDTGTLLVNQTGMNDEAYVRIVWDTSAWAGQSVRLVVHDSSVAGSWGHISIDDVRVGCAALTNNGLTFNVIGSANQPISSDGLSPSQLYAADPMRPQFHYTPYFGWINDPCGLIQWNGRHQRFHQYDPYTPVSPSAIQWSHADSPDGVHWNQLPVALDAPYSSNRADSSGRWTGSAINDNGTLRVIFTEFTDVSLHPEQIDEVIYSASSTDGINFSYYSGNPIVGTQPPDSASGYRDPKVFFDTTSNSWKMVVGSGDSTHGKVYLYSTTDFLSWTYDGILFEGDGSHGTMYECPNFFPLNGKWVLFFGGNGQGWYHVGTYDGSTFVAENQGLLDDGVDAYAAQWYVDDSGRNIVVTWMYHFTPSKGLPTAVNGWVGTASIAREMFIRDDGGLGTRPVAEISTLSSGMSTPHGQLTISDHLTLGRSNTAQVHGFFDLALTTATTLGFLLYRSEAESVSVTYVVANHTLQLNTMIAGYGVAGEWSANINVPSTNILEFNILIDRSVLEVFTGDGIAMSVLVYPRYQDSNEICITATGGQTVLTNITLTEFGSAW